MGQSICWKSQYQGIPKFYATNILVDFTRTCHWNLPSGEHPVRLWYILIGWFRNNFADCIREALGSNFERFAYILSEVFVVSSVPLGKFEYSM
jgi:hypothetical protein